MKLKSFGCSFIFGSELRDDGRNGAYATPSNLTWPALVAKQTARTYECHARPGSGNLQIAEQVMSQATVSDATDLFVIGWTWIDRFDYWDVTDTQRRRPWHTIMPNNSDSISKTYYKHLHSEYRDKLTNLIYINMAIKTVQERGIPLVMTYMDGLLFDQNWHTNSVIDLLQQNIQPLMTTFEGKNFLDWSREHKYLVSDLWHPLEQAHQAAADYMLKNKFLKKEL